MKRCCGITSVVELADIEKAYRIGESEVSILKGINLDIEEGEFIALMGPSGSGKSTLMNIVGCLDRPTKGRFMLLSRDVSKLSDDQLAKVRRDELGFIFQTFNLIGRISVLKNVELPMVLSETPRAQRRARALELLRSVGLEHRIDFSSQNISGGERQRVAIARALANDPAIIIADEPTGNLDLKSSNEVMNIMKELHDEGRTIIMVTHNPEITENCDRVIRLRDGRVLGGRILRSGLFFLSHLLLIMILIIGPASASYIYHIPVNVQSSTEPAVLMPGDTAILSIELQNGAAQYGAGSETLTGTLSTPINGTTLRGTNEIAVISPDYKDIGMIGPTDKVTLYYKIKAANNISNANGTYFMDFGVSGGYEMVQINRKIPVKVDSSAVSIARADVPTKPSINLNVANPRANTVNAVTIVPSAQGIRFSPDQYYIGTMDPDEVFTISFGIDSDNPAKPINRPVNLSFVAKFKNGDTWHESVEYITSYMPPKDNSRQNSYLLPAGVGALILLGAGIFLYRRKKMASKLV